MGDQAAKADQCSVTTEVVPTDVANLATCLPEPRRPQDRIGSLAGPYHLLTILGEGGGGTVYEAEQVHTKVSVAVKVVGETWMERPVIAARFQREIEIIRLLNHPNIVSIVDEGYLEDGAKFYAMELLRGEDLDSVLQRSVRLSPEESHRILAPVCSALSAAHDAGITHRDLKAGNVFVESGSPPKVKLLDFGIARVEIPRNARGLTARGAHVGTPANMAPEQILCQAPDPRTDIYAAGVLLFRMLTGEHPFGGSTPEEIMQAHLSAPPPVPSRQAPISPALDAVVLRCLQKRPEARFQSVDEFWGAFTKALGRSQSKAISSSRTKAWAVYAEGVSLGRHPMSEDVQEILVDIVDECAERFAELGYRHAFETGAGVLMVKPTTDGETLADGRALVAAAASMGNDIVDECPDGHGIAFAVHVGDVLFDGEDAVAGGLLDIPGWRPEGSRRPGLRLTSRARDILRRD